MTYPTNAEIDAAVPPAGTPHRGLTNEVLKKLAAGPSISDIGGITAIGQTLLQATDAEYAREALNAAADNHTHDNATQTANGFMSSQDKVKLDGIQPGAQVNASWGSITGQPAVVAAGATAEAARDSIGAGTSNLQLGTTNDTAAPGNHRHPNATSTADGFMSKEDKEALTNVLTDPTETKRGAPMEATAADVTAATSGAKMMSPRRVLAMIREAVSEATETLRGTLRVATPAEISSGNAGVALTPAGIAHLLFDKSAVVTFTDPGTYTWTVPDVLRSGVKKAFVQVQGGGGSGRSLVGATGSTQGGCGGGYAQKLLSLKGVVTVTITVGPGGASVVGSAGIAGGASSFGTYVSATGGSGGDSGRGVSGKGAGGDINLAGGLTIEAISMQASGGGSFFGSGGAAGALTLIGAAGAAYGAGGSSSINGLASGAGAAGAVIISY